MADTYKSSLETCQGLLQDAEKKLTPLEDEVATLREGAALLEETEENVKALTKAVETANTEKDIAILDASAAEARGAVKVVADFKVLDEYVAELHKRYDGGWAATMRCVCKTVPGFDWNVIEDAYAVGHHLTPFERDPNFADEDAIADVDPREPLEAFGGHLSVLLAPLIVFSFFAIVCNTFNFWYCNSPFAGFLEQLFC